jgi:hypothetical protein
MDSAVSRGRRPLCSRAKSRQTRMVGTKDARAEQGNSANTRRKSNETQFILQLNRGAAGNRKTASG